MNLFIPTVQTEKLYFSPTIELLEVDIEQGFAASFSGENSWQEEA